MTKRLWILGMLCAGFICPLLAQGDAEAGKVKYIVCVACHGQNGEGNKVLNSPAIAGQEDWYIIRQLKYFKDGIRGNNPKDPIGMTMRPMAMTLTTDQDIENVAAYISQMKPIKPEPTLDGDAAKGKTTYDTICATCHAQDGSGMKEMNSPKVYIQQDWYLHKQLKDFKAGIRGTDPKDITGMTMRPMAMTLVDEQAMKDVVAYMMSLAK